jgi:hypothetical protein
MDAAAARDERRRRGRRSRVVLTPRRWRQVFANQFARRRWQQSPVTEESSKETVKTIAQGRPGVSGEPVVTTLVCFIISHARLWVRRAPGFPCALCFSRAEIAAQLGRVAPRERGGVSIVTSSFRGDAKHRTRMCNCTSENLEIPRCAIAHLRSGACAPSRNDEPKDGLLRGACHRARVRATRWLAMTMRGNDDQK